MKTVCQTSRQHKGFVSCCTVRSSATPFLFIFVTPFLPRYQFKHRHTDMESETHTCTYAHTYTCAHTQAHIHSHNGITELAAEVSASLQRQLDDNPAGVTLLKVTHRSHTLFLPLSAFMCLSHTHTLIKSCNQADFCMY